MVNKKKKNDLNEMSFEQTIGELTSIVSKIEQGQIPLHDSLEQYEKGMELIKHCREILSKAEKRIEKVSKEQSENKSQAPEEDSDDLF